MYDRIKYGLRVALLIGVLGGLAFFIWNVLDSAISNSIFSGIYAFIVFGILGFILGMLIYSLE